MILTITRLPLFRRKLEKQISTGKSLSKALIFASTNPQYDDRLVMKLGHVFWYDILGRYLG